MNIGHTEDGRIRWYSENEKIDIYGKKMEIKYIYENYLRITCIHLLGYYNEIRATFYDERKKW